MAGYVRRNNGTPRPAETYRGARRNSEQRKAFLAHDRNLRRQRWRDLGLAAKP